MTDDLGATLRDVAALLTRLGIPFMVVGSVAAMAHGRSRGTQDFDLVVDLDGPRLRALLAELPRDRYYVSDEAAWQALRDQTLFNLIDVDTGWKVDLVPRKRRPFSRQELERRQPHRVFGIEVPVAAVEDVILAKLEWAKAGGSARQLEDVRELVRLAGDRLDLAHVERWAPELGVTELWEELRSELFP